MEGLWRTAILILLWVSNYSPCAPIVSRHSWKLDRNLIPPSSGCVLRLFATFLRFWGALLVELVLPLRILIHHLRKRQYFCPSILLSVTIHTPRRNQWHWTNPNTIQKKTTPSTDPFYSGKRKLTQTSSTPKFKTTRTSPSISPTSKLTTTALSMSRVMGKLIKLP